MQTREPHNQPGHLNTYILDQDQYFTAYGKHARVLVFEQQDGTPWARVDYRHGLRRPTDREIIAVMRRDTKWRGKCTLTRTPYVGHLGESEEVEFHPAR